MFCLNILIISFLVLAASGLVVNKKEHHKLLLVSFDGFRWDYSDRDPDLEGLKYLRENGVKAEYMKPSFPTQTSPNHFSIATGLYPESHGVVHNCNYNLNESGARSTFYTTLAVNDWWDNGAEPIWITAVNQGLKSGGYLFPGSYANISGVGATKSILEKSTTPKEEEDWRKRINDTMSWFIEDDLDMIALYFEQPDSSGHDRGPDSPRINSEMLPLLSRTIMYIVDQVEAFGLTDQLNIIFTSDHGMTTINKDTNETISLATYVNQSLIDFQFAYGPLGLVKPKPGEEEYVKQKLTEGNTNMQVFLKDEIPERWNFKNNDRIPPIVIVAKPGWSIYQLFVFHVNAGEHGYDNDFEEMRTTYYSIGPSFKKNYVVEGFENVHIYPLMCHLLGLEPAPNNGSLDILAKTLVEFSDSTTTEPTATESVTTSTVPITTTSGVDPLASFKKMMLFISFWLIAIN